MEWTYIYIYDISIRSLKSVVGNPRSSQQKTWYMRTKGLESPSNYGWIYDHESIYYITLKCCWSFQQSLRRHPTKPIIITVDGWAGFFFSEMKRHPTHAVSCIQMGSIIPQESIKWTRRQPSHSCTPWAVCSFPWPRNIIGVWFCSTTGCQWCYRELPKFLKISRGRRRKRKRKKRIIF